jgi:two-component system sensor histidine kinase TctE
MLALWTLNAWVTFRAAFDSANRVHDRTLIGSVLAVAERITIDDGTVVVDLPYSALEMLESNIQGRVYYRVSHADGRNITGYEDFPSPTTTAEPGVPFFYDAEYRGDKVRVAALRRRLYDETVDEPVLIQVSESAELRRVFSREIFYKSVLSELGLIVLAVLVVSFAIGRSLRTLYQIRNQVHDRDKADLSPIDASMAPREIRPLIDAINEHTARLAKMINARKQFIADAAHQLKTPLTLLRTQADFASRQQGVAAMNEVLDDLRRNTEQVSHLVDQLLALSRAEGNAAPALAELDLTELARRTTFEWLPSALRRSIDLGFEGESHARVAGNEFLLHELIKNLVDNALRFTPAGGNITVRVAVNGDRALLSVEDTGIGIPADERARVFDRFYQIPGRDPSGCGLGLAIVKQIAEIHSVRVRVRDGKEGRGAAFDVEFHLFAATSCADTEVPVRYVEGLHS